MPDFAERFFRSGALRIHVRDWGDAPLPPLVLVHGLRDHSHSFDELARGLIDRFHVLAIDLRGHGDSETTPYYAFGHFVLDLHNLVRALRLQKPILVGHSMGGEIVSRVAGSFPDLASRVVMIEGLGPPPIDMEESGKWTVDGFARIDRAIAGHPACRPRRPPTSGSGSGTHASPSRRRASWRSSARARARTAPSNGSSTRCSRRWPSTRRSTSSSP
jgi:pimeloyl-ACP methyl ester carboxylesterase